MKADKAKCILREYLDKDYLSVVNKVVSEKYLLKYLNKSIKYRILSSINLYKTYFSLLEYEN